MALSSEKFYLIIMNLDYDRQSEHAAVIEPLHHQWSVLVCNVTNNTHLHFFIVKISGFVYATAASTCSCPPVHT